MLRLVEGDKLSNYSKEKMKRYSAEHYQKNRDKLIEQHKAYAKSEKGKITIRMCGKRLRENRLSIINDAKNKPCMDCGGKFPLECMDFDHVRGEKVRPLSNMASCSVASILDEIDKCDIVCSNCHRIRTMKRRIAEGNPTGQKSKRKQCP